MVAYIWVNTGSGNGLLPDGNKQLLKPMLTYHHWCSVNGLLPDGNKQLIKPMLTYHHWCSVNGLLPDGNKQLLKPMPTYHHRCSVNELLPDGNKQFPKSMPTYHHRCSEVFTWEQFHKKCLRTQSEICVPDYTFKITTTSPRGQYVKQILWNRFCVKYYTSEDLEKTPSVRCSQGRYTCFHMKSMELISISVS